VVPCIEVLLVSGKLKFKVDLHMLEEHKKLVRELELTAVNLILTPFSG
jgi:hypothetical protein